MDSILARIQLPSRKKVTEARHAHIPEVLRLPDGREVVTKTLLHRATRPEIWNLQRGTIINAKATGYKYSAEEREWIAGATEEAVMARFKLRKYYARTLIKKMQERQHNGCNDFW